MTELTLEEFVLESDQEVTKEQYLDLIDDGYKERRSRKWFVHFRGAVYANDIDFGHPETIEAAIDYALSWLGTDKVPAGTQFWMG